MLLKLNSKLFGYLFLGACFFLAAPFTFALDSGIKVPPLTQPIIDESNLLSARSLAQISSVLRKLHEQNNFQMAIYIPNSMNGLDIESFSMAVADEWKLGKKGSDKGVLLLIAPNEKRMRLEVGYGLEGDLTDAESRRILDNTVRPYFRARDYEGGLLAAVGAVSEKLKLNLSGEIRSSIPSKGSASRTPKSILIIFLVIGFFIWKLLMLVDSHSGTGSRWRGGGRSHGGYGGWGGSGGGWGGSSGSGGGFSGGGGGFGGGGASSDW